MQIYIKKAPVLSRRNMQFPRTRKQRPMPRHARGVARVTRVETQSCCPTHAPVERQSDQKRISNRFTCPLTYLATDIFPV